MRRTVPADEVEPYLRTKPNHAEQDTCNEGLSLSALPAEPDHYPIHRIDNQVITFERHDIVDKA